MKQDIFKDADECEAYELHSHSKVLVFLSSTCVFVIWDCNRSLARDFACANKDLHYSPN